jgi:hypothetical protein
MKGALVRFTVQEPGVINITLKKQKKAIAGNVY